MHEKSAASGNNSLRVLELTVACSMPSIMKGLQIIDQSEINSMIHLYSVHFVVHREKKCKLRLEFYLCVICNAITNSPIVVYTEKCRSFYGI